MAGAAAVAVSDPLQLLDRAVSLVINGWHVLQVAVENSLGGPQSREKAEWMVEVTTKYLSNNGQNIMCVILMAKTSLLVSVHVLRCDHSWCPHL